MSIYVASIISFVAGFLIAMLVVAYVEHDNDEHIGDVLNDDGEE